MPKRPEVEQWLAGYDRPLKPVMQAVRDIIIAADARIDEGIKGQSPTFTFNGNLASFNPRSKKHVSLMFHAGAMIPGAHPKLEGTGDSARFMNFPDLPAVLAAKRDLVRVVRAWCDWQDARTPKARKEAALRKPVRRKKRPVAAAAKTAAAKKATSKAASGKAAAKKPASRSSSGAAKKPAGKARARG